MLPNGLFDGVDAIRGEGPETFHGVVGGEPAVGIDTELNLVAREPFPDMPYELQLTVEVDGTNLQFHAVEPFLELLLQPFVHLVERPHPHEAVDGNALLTTREGGVGEGRTPRRELVEGGLEAEEHRWVGAQGLDGNGAVALHVGGGVGEQSLVIGLRHGIAAEVGEH